MNITQLFNECKSAINSVFDASNILELQRILTEGGDHEECSLLDYINHWGRNLKNNTERIKAKYDIF